ncbi:MAG: 23S rRNA (guanosine(2251)-2'-O)-methyltransferase RlmB [Anaeroplasmataceae bacterium]
MIKIYGKNCIYEAIKQDDRINEIFVLDSFVQKEKNFVDMLDSKKIKYKIKDKKFMDANFQTHHQGIAAFAKDYEFKDIEDVLNKAKSDRKIILILDGINDPHNFGAIIRSCDAFSVDAIVIPKNRSVTITESVARVSTGAIEYVDIVQVNNLNNTIAKLKDNGFWIVGTDALATQTASDIDKSLNIAVVIGSEGFGISKLVKKQCDYTIKIPMTGHVNSLNASVSAGIIIALLK